LLGSGSGVPGQDHRGARDLESADRRECLAIDLFIEAVVEHFGCAAMSSNLTGGLKSPAIAMSDFRAALLAEPSEVGVILEEIVLLASGFIIGFVAGGAFWVIVL
jgi:hypothetical protein